MKKLIITLSLILIGLFGTAQYEFQQTTIDNHVCNVSMYVPQGLGNKLPAVVFVPGLGEQNTYISGLYVNGPMTFIKQGWKPNYIVMGIQPDQGWPDGWFIHYMIDSLIKDGFPIDPDRIVLTGLSAGANCLYSYMDLLNAQPTWFKPIAVIPMSFGISNPPTTWKNTPAWGFCSTGDWVDPNQTMKAAWDYMIGSGWTNKRFTVYSGGHCCWNTFYDPTYTESFGLTSRNIYDWAMQFARIVSLPVLWGDVNYDCLTSKLQWTVESESNIERYEVQESIDGTNWNTIGSVPSVNSGSRIIYSYKL